MRFVLVSILSFLTTSIPFAVNADSGQTVTIPNKVSSNILKRHPKAQDLQAATEIHFGQTLLQVSFKDETGEEILELFNAKGHFYGNVLKVEDLSDILPPVVQSLKKAFPQHEIQRVELIVNPNSAGEEYEIYLHSGDSNWRIATNDQGEILDQLKLAP